MSDWNYDMDSCPLDTKVYLLSSNDCFLLPQREYVGTITHNGRFKTRGECYSGDPDYFYRSAIVAWKPFEQQTKLAIYVRNDERECMRTVYIADDGKEFDNEFNCEHHEWMLNHPNLKYIKIYDNRTGELFDDIMTDDAYNYGDKVVIPTEFALKDLHDWATYSGYCYFHQITEVGTWVFNEDENAYEKVGD